MADDGIHGLELWRSDGTERMVLVKTLILAKWDRTMHYWCGLTNIDGTLYFVANDGTHGFELWKSDGTETGTVMVKDTNAGEKSCVTDEYHVELMNIDGTLYFMADDGIHGLELWRSDGTESGTVMVKDVQLGEEEYAKQSVQFSWGRCSLTRPTITCMQETHIPGVGYGRPMEVTPAQCWLSFWAVIISTGTWVPSIIDSTLYFSTFGKY